MKIKTMSASTVGIRQFLVIISILVLSLNGKGTTNETTTLRINTSTDASEARGRLTLTTKGELLFQSNIPQLTNWQLTQEISLINLITKNQKFGCDKF